VNIGPSSSRRASRADLVLIAADFTIRDVAHRISGVFLRAFYPERSPVLIPPLSALSFSLTIL